MKVLVIGQGGREHALVKAFSESPSIHEVHALPGNDGMQKQAVIHNIPLSQFEAITQLCVRLNFDFVFIGPEDPLVNGLADHLRSRGFLVVGPDAEAARLEGSKIFAKEFMLEAGVPTASYHVVNNVKNTLEATELFKPPYVLKADGLAAGKGVFICHSLEELKAVAIDLFEKKSLGFAGEKALLEQSLVGWELSLLVLTNGSSYEILPIAQDHKRLMDNNLGPNTGGMGTIAPVLIDSKLFKQIENDIVIPSIKLISKKKFVYRGILFIGLMITPNGPFVLEYNVRLGDPETQAILPLIQTDIGELCKKLSQGKLEPVKYKKISACCVVMAAEGYPQSAVKGTQIDGDILYETESSYFIHAGTKKIENHWVTNGGRVIGAIGLGSNHDEAIKNAYRQCEKIRWKGIQVRKDIGKNLPSPT